MGCFFGLAFKKYGMPLQAIVIGEFVETTIGYEVEHRLEQRLKHKRNERLSEHAETNKSDMLHEIETVRKKRRHEYERARHDPDKQRNDYSFYAAYDPRQHIRYGRAAENSDDEHHKHGDGIDFGSQYRLDEKNYRDKKVC